MILKLSVDIEIKERKTIDVELDINEESLLDYCIENEPINRNELEECIRNYIAYDDYYIVDDAVDEKIQPNEDTVFSTEDFEFENLEELIDIIEYKIEYTEE